MKIGLLQGALETKKNQLQKIKDDKKAVVQSMVMEENNRILCIEKLYEKKLDTFSRMHSCDLSKEMKKELMHRQS